MPNMGMEAYDGIETTFVSRKGSYAKVFPNRLLTGCKPVVAPLRQE